MQCVKRSPNVTANPGASTARRCCIPVVLAVFLGAFIPPTIQAGPPFRSGFSFRAHCAPHHYAKPFRSFAYRSHAYYPRFHSSYSFRPYCPPSFPYYTPRIYVVPQKQCYVPSTVYRPAYRTVIVLSQNGDDETDAGSIEGAVDAWAAAGQPAGELPSDAAPELDSDAAWAELQSGNHASALAAFAALANAERSSVRHRVGYGLAAALAGDKLTAAYALRCAFEADAVAAAAVPLGSEIVAALEPLALEYRQWVLNAPDNFNARFLYAAASHWIDKDAAARTVLAESVTRGDNEASTANLLQLLEEPRAVQASL